MKIAYLLPAPNRHEEFHSAKKRFISVASGCYVLTNIYRDVMYIGLTDDLKRRIGEHLKDPTKTAVTAIGKAHYFYWREVPKSETKRIERTWMNKHLANEGELPILNSNYSPI